MAKRNDWINAGGAVRGNPTRGQRNGQKRGTRYVWKGIVNTPQAAPTVKLVKAENEEG